MPKIPTKKPEDPIATSGKLLKRAQGLVRNILAQNQDNTDLKFQNVQNANQFLSALSQLTRAVADLERARLDKEGSMRLAGRQILWELSAGLQKDPDVWEKVCGLIQESLNRHAQTSQQSLQTKSGQPLGRKQVLMVSQAHRQIEGHEDVIDAPSPEED